MVLYDYRVSTKGYRVLWPPVILGEGDSRNHFGETKKIKWFGPLAGQKVNRSEILGLYFPSSALS